MDLFRCDGWLLSQLSRDWGSNKPSFMIVFVFKVTVILHATNIDGVDNTITYIFKLIYYVSLSKIY